MIVANETDEAIMISLRVQRSTKNSYLLSWHKSQGLGLPIVVLCDLVFRIEN